MKVSWFFVRFGYNLADFAWICEYLVVSAKIRTFLLKSSEDLMFLTQIRQKKYRSSTRTTSANVFISFDQPDRCPTKFDPTRSVGFNGQWWVCQLETQCQQVSCKLSINPTRADLWTLLLWICVLQLVSYFHLESYKIFWEYKATQTLRNKIIEKIYGHIYFLKCVSECGVVFFLEGVWCTWRVVLFSF